MKRMIAMAFLFVAGTASGQQLPSFEIERHCEKAGGGRDYCVQRTQGIYEDLRQRWDGIPTDIKGRCLRWLKTSAHPDSYYLLQSCLINSTMPPPRWSYPY